MPFFEALTEVAGTAAKEAAVEIAEKAAAKGVEKAAEAVEAVVSDAVNTTAEKFKGSLHDKLGKVELPDDLKALKPNAKMLPGDLTPPAPVPAQLPDVIRQPRPGVASRPEIFYERPKAAELPDALPLLEPELAKLPDDLGQGGSPERALEAELDALQERADTTAQKYNAKYSPYERAVSKGIEGVTKTPNGGVSFENSDVLYVMENGTKGIVTIEATGKRFSDYTKANKALGLAKQPEGYTWHHLDNYHVKENTVTMELVRDDAHNSTKPHSGGCAQYDAVHGRSYKPPKTVMEERV